MAPPLVRFPEGPITPHGAYHILHDKIPQMSLMAFDETVIFHMLGGLSIPDRQRPGRVEVTEIKGLIPPWRTIDQKGASQDGITFVDALYDPTEVELDVRVRGKNPADCRRVGRYLMDSLDVKRTSRLAWFTHDLGYWWADLRWLKPPVDAIGGIKNSTADLSLRLRVDQAFWQSYPCVDQFRFQYAAAKDDFSVDYSTAKNLGPNWPQRYNGNGGGYCRSKNGKAGWFDDPNDTFTTLSRTVVNGPYKGFSTVTNNQVVTQKLGSLQEWSFPGVAENHIWLRMGRNSDGSWNGYGVRIIIMLGQIRLSYFTNFVETLMKTQFMLIPPLPNETWTAVAGYEGNERMFKLLRNGASIMTHREVGAGSPLGAAYRGIGFGMKAAGAFLTQATPASVVYMAAGDNATIGQTGFLRRVNAGDQDMYDNYICNGPGTFRFWNGPGADEDEYVEFGPILQDQVMYIRTDPRKRGVVDMTSIAPTPQQLTQFQKALKDFLSFATGSNTNPLARQIESTFGIKPPQGNPYSLLKGRWSKAAAIPPKSPGRAPDEYHVKVSIAGGNADSSVVATGTPLRRMPY